MPVVYFAGSHKEIAHHAASISQRICERGGEQDLHVCVAETDDILRDANPGDLTIFYSEHFDRFRDACSQLKERGVATLYMIDGILEWRNAWVNRADEVACPYAMRPALAHKIAVIGNSQSRVIESWGNAGKTEVVGVPRLDAYVTRLQSQAKLGADENVIDQRSGPLRILVMTAKTPAFTETQHKRVKDSLLDLKRWAEANEQLDHCDLQWTWRLTKDLHSEIGVSNSLSDLTGKELADVLANVDMVISTPSTAIVEAMLNDLPVAVLDYHNCPHYVQVGWDIASSSHIEDTLRSMAIRDPARMLFQENQLYDTLYLESSATERMVELIDSMLRITADRLTDDQPLAFPPSILPTPNQLSAEFSHQRLFPSVDSFRRNDQAELQAEHAHARREIYHLRSEIRQLQSELDQAHQIFESIDQHPIAGPIVRLRQRFLDWMSSFNKKKSQKAEHDYEPSPPSEQIPSSPT